MDNRYSTYRCFGPSPLSIYWPIHISSFYFFIADVPFRLSVFAQPRVNVIGR